VHVHLQNLPVKFVYEGHRVKVKVIGTNSLSVFAVRTLNFGCFDHGTLISGIRYIRISGSSSYIKNVGSLRSMSQEQRSVSVCPDHRWSIFDWKTIMFCHFLLLTILISQAL